MPRPIYPPLTPGVPRLSQSEMEDYLRCSHRYFARRERRHRRATLPMLIGSAVAEGARADNAHKIATQGHPLTVRETVEASVAAYELEIEESEVEAAPLEVGAAKDDTATAARTYATVLSPEVRDVVEAECATVVRLPGDPERGIEDLELAGTPDVVTRTALRDTKSGQPWTQDRADRSRQLTTYDWLHKGKYGTWAPHLAIDSLSRTKGGWRAETLWTRRTDKERQGLLAIARRVRAGIEQGVSLPAPEGAWWCSRKWCEEWTECPFAQGGRT